jgi:hypothetical protein
MQTLQYFKTRNGCLRHFTPHSVSPVNVVSPLRFHHFAEFSIQRVYTLLQSLEGKAVFNHSLVKLIADNRSGFV